MSYAKFPTDNPLALPDDMLPHFQRYYSSRPTARADSGHLGGAAQGGERVMFIPSSGIIPRLNPKP